MASQAERFRGLRLQPGDPSVALEAVQTGARFFVNDVDMSRYPRLADYRAARRDGGAFAGFRRRDRGVVAFAHDSPDVRFDDDAAAKATILADPTGYGPRSPSAESGFPEEHRRAMILAELATASSRTAGHRRGDGGALPTGCGCCCTRPRC